MKTFSVTYHLHKHKKKSDDEGSEIGSDRREITENTPLLVYQCFDCGDLVTIHSVEDVFLATSSQLASESEKLYCNDCDVGY